MNETGCRRLRDFGVTETQQFEHRISHLGKRGGIVVRSYAAQPAIGTPLKPAIETSFGITNAIASERVDAT